MCIRDSFQAIHHFTYRSSDSHIPLSTHYRCITLNHFLLGGGMKESVEALLNPAVSCSNLSAQSAQFLTRRVLHFAIIVDAGADLIPVSYTHLDVYKRQTLISPQVGNIAYHLLVGPISIELAVKDIFCNGQAVSKVGCSFKLSCYF